MKQAFQAAEADFSGIDGGRDLHVTDVVHQATIAVDDQGTVASGATGAVFSRKSAVQSSLRVDRPFLFAIRDDATGAILFQGRVVDPTQ
jgi:serpin B